MSEPGPIEASSPPAPPPPQVPRRAFAGPCPLSFAQQRLWFLNELEPGGLYNIGEAWKITGPLDHPALCRALDAVAARHEALRTTIRAVDGVPMQVVSEKVEIVCPRVDVGVEGKAPAEEIHRRVDEEVGRPFDLARDPMLRALLLRESPESHVLVLTAHHIASDGWSVSVLRREIAAFYRAFRRGDEPDLPDLPIQYADFAVWQRERLSGELFAAQLAHWKRELADAPAVCELPTDRPRPAAQSFQGATCTRGLGRALSDGVRALARRERSTLFMTLAAAFQVLLHRWTGQEDVVVGTPVANRPAVELEPLIGFFANTLVLRARLRDDPSFRSLLASTRESALGAFENQDLPFEKLVEELRPERGGGHNPIFQVMFAMQNAPRSALALDGTVVTPIDVAVRDSKFDLGLYVSDSPDGLRTTWEYASALFDAPRIERLADHFANLLRGIVADPDERISRLPLMSEAERHRIVVEWNATEREIPDETVTALFEAEAARRPDATALEFRGGRWTYGELNARADHVARSLSSAGVREGMRVGVALARCPEMIAALVGILKAGAAYVPLDPEYPAERLAWMRQDAALAAVVTSGPGGSGSDIPAIIVDRERPRPSARSGDTPRPGGDPDGIAYVMYTSGSTGKPKGVAVTHRGIVRLVRNAGFADLSEGQTFLQAASLSFDASTFEIWAPLANGGRLVLLDPGIPALSDIEAAIREHGVTTLWLTAGLFHLAVDERPEALAPLAQLLAGGDVLSPAHVAKALARLPRTRLINGYGPTETTTFACCHTIEAGDPGRGTIPIGRPIGNTRVYLLDRHLQPVPVGVTGEMFIGGVGVARGYWNQPALTASRFVPDPFSGDPGARLFRTGDLARYREEGEIEFLGRRDAQVKIRGFRVEPAEVEAALAEHPDVREVAVEGRRDGSAETALDAYLVRRDGCGASAEDLRHWAASRLPAYMVPSTFTFLEGLPLSANGKLDRRALPAPRGENGGAFVPPRDALELQLSWIWEEILGAPRVSVRDNFFALGGHSLLAVRLFARLENVLGRRLPLATLFQAPTIEQLAAVIREEGWTEPWSSLVVVQGGGARPPFFCVPGVGGNVVGFHTLARHLGADQPVYGLQAQGLDGVSPPHTRVEEMAAHYVAQMRAMIPRGPYFLGGASFGGRVAFEMARQLEAAGERPALVALFDTFAPGAAAPAPVGVLVRHAVERSFARIAYHMENLLLQKERGRYLRKKALTVRRRIRSRLWQLAYRFFAEYSKPLPRALRSVREAGYLANRDYMPGPFPGRVTLFRAAIRSVADATDRDMGWSRLALGGVEVHHVAGDHENMLVEPHVRVLARELRACIDRGISETESSPFVPKVRAV